MKKLIISLFVVMMSLVGIGGATAGSANAVTCPYSGCVATKTVAHAMQASYKRGHNDYVGVRVTPLSGSGSPQGAVRMICRGPGATHVKYRLYNGSPFVMHVRLWVRGTWTCVVQFRSATKWRGSSGATSFRVR